MRKERRWREKGWIIVDDGSLLVAGLIATCWKDCFVMLRWSFALQRGHGGDSGVADEDVAV